MIKSIGRGAECKVSGSLAMGVVVGAWVGAGPIDWVKIGWCACPSRCNGFDGGVSSWGRLGEGRVVPVSRGGSLFWQAHVLTCLYHRRLVSAVTPDVPATTPRTPTQLSVVTTALRPRL